MGLKLWKKLGLPAPKSEASTGPLSLVDNEVYSGIEIPEMPFFARLDGWRFRVLAKEIKLKKPFDPFFAKCMTKTAEAFFKFFNPCLAYIFSDEINLLFVKNPTFKRIEKIDSVFAGYATSIFLSLMEKKYKKKVFGYGFDCRTIPISKKEILRYLIWRQAEAFRNFNNGMAQYVLMRSGLSARAAARRLSGLKVRQLREVMREHGVDLRKVPRWQMAGVLVYKRPYFKVGYNPIKRRKVKVQRMKVIENWAPPAFAKANGKKFIGKILSWV